MTSEQKRLVQESFRLVVPIKDQAAQMFYDRLFVLDPTVRALFQGEMKRQGSLLMAMLGTAVNGLNRLEEIVPPVQELGRRHAGYGVRSEHYSTVAAALLWTLEKGLGAAWTPEVQEAWTACYTLLAQTMQAAAAEKGMGTSAN